jgi:hypothetical protein
MMDNEIINPCSFNKSSECKINLIENLTNEQIELMQDFLLDYHENLQGYYKSLVKILNVTNIKNSF